MCVGMCVLAVCVVDRIAEGLCEESRSVVDGVVVVGVGVGAKGE